MGIAGDEVHGFGGLAADHTLDGRQRCDPFGHQTAFGGAAEGGVGGGLANLGHGFSADDQLGKGGGKLCFFVLTLPAGPLPISAQSIV